MFKYSVVAKKREKYGLTQESLSILTGIRQEQIARIERGKNLNPTLLTLEKLAKALNCKVADLVDESQSIA